MNATTLSDLASSWEVTCVAFDLWPESRSGRIYVSIILKNQTLGTLWLGLSALLFWLMLPLLLDIALLLLLLLLYFVDHSSVGQKSLVVRVAIHLISGICHTVNIWVITIHRWHLECMSTSRSFTSWRCPHEESWIAYSISSTWPFIEPILCWQST